MLIYEYLGVVNLLVFLITFIAILYIFHFLKDRPTNLPPGPVGLPYVGYFPFLGPRPHVQLSELAKKYGNVMSFTVLGKTVIYLNNYETTIEAFLKKGKDFAGRPEYFIYFGWITDNQGKRACLGKSLAKMELFLFFTSILQNFQIMALEGDSKELEHQSAIISSLKPFNIIAIQRE